MIWALTKGKHNLAITALVRWWLRMSFSEHFVVITFVTVAYTSLALIIILMTMRGFLFSVSSPFQFLFFFSWMPYAFLFVDALVDWMQTTSEIEALTTRSDIVLATRGEYIGGHPKLPHGRFVYFTLGGSLEAPNLTIVLPPTYVTEPSEGRSLAEPVCFNMPVLEVSKTKGTTKVADSLAQVMLTTLSVRRSRFFLGERAFLSVEYTGQAGRKHIVELGYFFRGADEVQNWRNYIVCSQAEADTGEKPYGPWRSLPKKSS